MPGRLACHAMPAVPLATRISRARGTLRRPTPPQLDMDMELTMPLLSKVPVLLDEQAESDEPHWPRDVQHALDATPGSIAASRATCLQPRSRGARVAPLPTPTPSVAMPAIDSLHVRA